MRYAPAELFKLPAKYDDMSKHTGWNHSSKGPDHDWAGEGDGSEHLTPEWRQETARLTERIRAVTGGEGRVRVSFGGVAVVNGTYAEQSGLREGLPYFRNEQQREELRCNGGYWRLGDAPPHLGSGYYRQRFDPSSPLPKQHGWELDSNPFASLPVPRVRPSWEHELLFGGRVHRQEDGPGPGGRGRFRCTEAGNTGATVEWAEADSRWVWMTGGHRWFYNAADEPHPPATGWKWDAGSYEDEGRQAGDDADGEVCPVLRSWLDTEEWVAYEEREQARQAMSTLQQSGAGALITPARIEPSTVKK